MNDSTTIRISVDTKKRLIELGNLDDSYNSVIEKLIDEHDKIKRLTSDNSVLINKKLIQSE